MILVTGASGKTGRAVISALVARNVDVRALVWSPDLVSSSKEIGAREVLSGDLNDIHDMRNAFLDVQAVYFICPNMSPNELEMGKIATHAARDNGTRHFVYHSVLHPQAEGMPHHWQKMRVEEQLFESGLDFTILQPAPYMQNVLGYWKSITERGVYPIPYGERTLLGMVDLMDVAEVAAKVLTQDGYSGGIYELAGSEIPDQTDVAIQLSQVLGRTIRTERITFDDWEKNARGSGLPEYSVDTLLKMFRYYDQYGLWGNSNVLRWLLGRQPTSFTSFLERTLKERS